MGKIFGLQIEDDKIIQYICCSDILIGFFGLLFVYMIFTESALDGQRTTSTFYSILFYIIFRILLVAFSLFGSLAPKTSRNRKIFKKVRLFQINTSVLTLVFLDYFVGQCLTNSYARYSPNQNPNFFDIFKKLHNPNSSRQVNAIYNLSLGLVCLNLLELFLSAIAVNLFFMYRNSGRVNNEFIPENGEIKSTFVSKRDTNSLRRINLPDQLNFQRIIQMKNLEIELTWGVPSHIIYETLLSELYTKKKHVQMYQKCCQSRTQRIRLIQFVWRTYFWQFCAISMLKRNKMKKQLKNGK